MYFLSITSLLPILIWSSLCVIITLSDPDVEICEKTELTGGVVTDENTGYLFQDKYYWQMNTKDGIMGYATLIVSKWPDIKDKIKTAFVVPTFTGLMTVFVVKDKWFGYQKGKKVENGLTTDWPFFQDLDITIAFPYNNKNSKVFIVYNENKNYTLYDFKSVTDPTIVQSGITSVRQDYLLFYGLSEDQEKDPTLKKTLNTILNPTAALSFDDNLVLISQQKYCSIGQDIQAFDKKCIPTDKTTANLLKCPLDLQQRPTTIPPESTSNEGESMESDAPVPHTRPTVMTTEEITKPVGSNRIVTTTPRVEAALEKETREKKVHDSEFWGFAFIGGIGGLAICALLGILLISKVGPKRRKGLTTALK